MSETKLFGEAKEEFDEKILDILKSYKLVKEDDNLLQINLSLEFQRIDETTEISIDKMISDFKC